MQHGGPKGQQHLGIMQSVDQEANIEKSSHTPTGYSQVNAGGTSQPMPHTGTSDGEVRESIPPQKWPTIARNSSTR